MFELFRISNSRSESGMNTKDWKEIKEAFAGALELDASERPSLLDDLSPEIRKQVERLLIAHEEAEDFIEKPVIVEREFVDGSGSVSVPEQIDEYRIIEQIGTGGMGTVFLAEQVGEGFSYRVALKLIKRGMDTESVLRRFLLERQILSNLDHPNIARLLDGGSTLDGVPYFVMEYVDGEEIRKYADSRHLGLNARLDLFQKVCGAVASAHQKLIVHRDLKPTNILVTKDGEPKLLDFGIAKLLSPEWNSGEEATVTQFRVMTPEYASPEQIAGEPTSTSADVYSLGVVLYELLTGQRPRFTKGKSPQQILDSAMTDEPPRPSSVVSERRSTAAGVTGDSLIPDTRGAAADKTTGVKVAPAMLRGDLDNIILKALRREPERRYQSVQEFSDDISRYRDGLPVRAASDTFTYRFGKFVKRHRTGVFAAAIVTALLLTTTGVAAYQAVKANNERIIAEARFNDVRALANSLIFDVHDSIRDLPGSTPARKALLSRAIEYLDKLAKENSEDMTLQTELASAYERVGDVQGSPLGPNLGDFDGALESYGKALAIRQSLFERSGPEEKYATAMLHSRLFRIKQVRGDLSEAEDHLRSAVAILEGLSTNDPLHTVTTARFSMELGDLLMTKTSEDTAQAVENYRKAISLANSIAPDPQNDIRDNDGRTLNEKILNVTQMSYRRLGQYFESHKQHVEARESFGKALIESEKLMAASDSTKPIAEVVVALSLGNLGRVEALTGDAANGLKKAERSRDICRAALDRDPKNQLAKGELAIALGNIAVIQNINGNEVESVANYTKAIEIQKEIAASNPQDTYNSGNLADSYASLGGVLEKSDRVQARRYYQLSYDIWNSMREKKMLPGYYAGKPDELLAKLRQ